MCDADLGVVWKVSCSVGMKEDACGFSFGVSLSWRMVCILFNRALAVSWSDETSSSVSISWKGVGFWAT